MMSSFATRFWLVILTLVTGLVIYRTARVTPEDEQKLERLLSSQPRKLHKDRLRTEEEVTRQTRWNVVKRIWMSDADTRRVLQIGASRSELTLYAKKADMHLVETFYHVTGVIQQELYTEEAKPMQRFRYFEADHAVYDFQTRTLLVYNVRFWGYRTEGHEVIDNPHTLSPEVMGTANSMTLFSEGGSKQFAAENLKMHILQENGLW